MSSGTRSWTNWPAGRSARNGPLSCSKEPEAEPLGGAIADRVGAEVDSSEPATGSGDQERIAVLRMLEEGKLTVAQAEELLQALEP